MNIVEAWAIPLMIRVALIRHLARVTEQVRQRREVCTFAESCWHGRFFKH